MKVDSAKLDLALARQCKSESDLRNGTSPTTLIRVRQGKELKPRTVGRIAKALGIDVTEILKEE